MHSPCFRYQIYIFFMTTSYLMFWITTISSVRVTGQIHGQGRSQTRGPGLHPDQSPWVTLSAPALIYCVKLHYWKRLSYNVWLDGSDALKLWHIWGYFSLLNWEHFVFDVWKLQPILTRYGQKGTHPRKLSFIVKPKNIIRSY